MLFEFDGENIAPNRLLNMPAQLFCKQQIGVCLLPKPGDKEMHIVFRDFSRGMDWVYKLNNGSGEITYLFNNNQSWEVAVDRQPIIDVLTGRMWSIDITSGDPAEELLKAFDAGDLTLMSKLLNADPNLANISYLMGRRC